MQNLLDRERRKWEQASVAPPRSAAQPATPGKRYFHIRIGARVVRIAASSEAAALRLARNLATGSSKSAILVQ